MDANILTRRIQFISLSLSAIFTLGASLLQAQQSNFERLSTEALDVLPPSARVSGAPGKMVFANSACRSYPLATVRSRIINIAVQEWAYFGFSVDDMSRISAENLQNSDWRRRAGISPDEAARVAASIAGYWAATPNSDWILQRQNASWESGGVGSRWRNPWSAAFISWVMCESGLGETTQFERAIAHHSYIDQAILAREQPDNNAAFVAYDAGAIPIEPGDMLCRGSRPSYQSIAERRTQLGEGARTHCDIVVKLDEVNKQIMVIGGNVRGWVRMKLLPASMENSDHLYPIPYSGRNIFAHLKLQAAPVAADAIEKSPTFQAISCKGFKTPASGSLASLALAPNIDCTE